MHGVIDETDNLKWQTPFKSGKPDKSTNGTSMVGQPLTNYRTLVVQRFTNAWTADLIIYRWRNNRSPQW